MDAEVGFAQGVEGCYAVDEGLFLLLVCTPYSSSFCYKLEGIEVGIDWIG